MNLTRHNYEEYFILYLDNELKAEECAQVQQFIRENPDLEEELLTLQKALLDPEEVYFFADKASLYREEAVSRAPIIHIWRRRISAAAAVLLLASGALWLWRETSGPHASTQVNHTVADRLPDTVAKQPDTVREDSVNPSQVVNPLNPVADTKGPVSATPHPGSAAASGNVPRELPSGAQRTQSTQAPSVALGTSGVSPAQAMPSVPDKGTSVAAINGVNGSLPSITQPNTSSDMHPTVPLNGSSSPSTQIASVAAPKNNPGNVTTEHAVSYHTLEDADQKNDENTILFVRADQVMNSGVKGFFRKASRVIKRSASLGSDNIHAEPDADR